MNLQTFLATPQSARNAAFVQARKEWLSILLHDWHKGHYDMHVPDFLCHHDIFNLSDPQLADMLPNFAHAMNTHYTHRYEAVNLLTSLGLPGNFALAAIDQSYNYDQENGDFRELLWGQNETEDKFLPTPQTGVSILIAYRTMMEMMSLEERNGEKFICVDGEPLYTSTGVNLVWMPSKNNPAA